MVKPNNALSMGISLKHVWKFFVKVLIEKGTLHFNGYILLSKMFYESLAHLWYIILFNFTCKRIKINT